jgi:hypothetical protein
MCLDTYVGCPNCREPAAGEVREIQLQTESIAYHLDHQGDANYGHEPEYSEELHAESDGYKCLSCGWQGTSLDDECVSEICECEECNPEAAQEEGDEPEQEVFLQLSGRHSPEVTAETPPEIRFLAEDACRWCLVIPRWRGVELLAEHPGVEVVLNPTVSVSDDARVFTYDHDNRKVVNA